METPEATPGATVPPEVSPELLEPLVTVVATLGELGATSGDIPLAVPPGSLRAGLVALTGTISRAMGHGHGEATHLRRALATAKATTGATLEPAVPRATAGDPWATVATITQAWQKAVASVEATWATLTGDAVRLRDACGTVATSEATTEATSSGIVTGLAEAVAQQDRAHRQLLDATRALPVTLEVATVAEMVTAHRTRVAEANAGLQAATEATEKMAVATVERTVAKERGKRATVAHELLDRLVASCHGATYFYCHLRRCLEDIEATVAAGRGGPKGGEGGLEVPSEVAQEGPGGPKDLLAAVAVAEALWDASAHLAKGHLLGTLQMARRLLVTLGVPSATTAVMVAQRCQDATTALPGLLPRGPR